MKTFKYILFITVFAVATACNKKLDVTPQQNITPEQIQTADDVKAVLFGGYKLLQGPGAFGEEFIFLADLLASENQVDFVGTFTEYRDIQSKNQNQNSLLALTMWSNAYVTINSMNTVISKIDLIDESERDAIRGEAEFIRGVVYFELVNFFAQPYSAGNVSTNPGVPLILDPQKPSYDPTTALVPRASVEAIYNQVLSDLEDAANTLPDAQSDFRATMYSAKAFLSRVYLNMHRYADAAAMANDVIESGQFSLVSVYDQAFNNVANSTEDVFAIQQSNQSNAGTANAGITTFYTSYPEGGRGDAQVDPGYLDIFPAGDERQSFTYESYGFSGIDGLYTGKWKDFYKAIPVVRLAEMYLTRGEANTRSGSQTGSSTPLEDINTVRERASAPPFATVTGDDFVDERFRELGFEGDRVWTLKRLQLDVDGFEYTYEKLILPIPQREIDVNPNLEQNPGY